MQLAVNDFAGHILGQLAQLLIERIVFQRWQSSHQSLLWSAYLTASPFQKCSELLDLDVQGLDPVGDLARGHAEDAGGFGLHPAGLFQGGDDEFLFLKLGVVDVYDFGICP